MFFDDDKKEVKVKKSLNADLIPLDISTMRRIPTGYTATRSSLTGAESLSDVCKAALGDSKKKEGTAPEAAQEKKATDTKSQKTEPGQKDSKQKDAGQKETPQKKDEKPAPPTRQELAQARRQKQETIKKEQAEKAQKKAEEDKKDTDFRNRARDIQNQIQWWEQQRGQGLDDCHIDGQVVVLKSQLAGIDSKYWY